MKQASPERTTISSPRFVVPAYFRPDVLPGDWETMVNQVHKVKSVILNPASGPGSEPDPVFYLPLAKLHRAGVTVLGYVDTGYGQRPIQQALADFGLFLRWYGVTGVCFDRVSVSAEDLDRYAALSRIAREMGAGTVLFNHGAHPLAAYAEHADLLGTFEGSYRAYLQLSVPRWTRTRPAEQFYHVVHSVPREHLADAFLLAVGRRAGCTYVTDRAGPNPYDCLPAGVFEYDMSERPLPRRQIRP